MQRRRPRPGRPGARHLHRRAGPRHPYRHPGPRRGRRRRPRPAVQCGESLAAGVPVQLSDGLKDAPGWSAAGQGTAGASIYKKADGCQVAARVSTNQGPLSVPGNDKASTEALFHYLDPSILPGYLATDTLRWGGDADKPGPRVEVLVYYGGATGTRAAVSYARMFAKAGSSVYVSVACPDRGSLAAARADVAARLAVLPPSS
ncbi:hypothetical protein ACRQ5B_11265 [Pseudarthrobacter sp. L19]|uniref:hypothetical protein n=1 Tax=Pseudarthrobacter sp. L19 TaxID=3423951 RepID=UPI003D7C0CDA